ncbi:hypothetical protein GCM10022198_12710 [Klugiella xanthotipulae]|uniref:Mannosyltransferase PIG-V n=1 Tax=Klugiella xanthotipulae TaxID=244735 RepID=A0A543I492_9MICO|nr:mannosyltransferase family protein [Klugiella xanthotipulae]TQM65361.1 mannosyltransferase PIG-V [Klugiella xanthotipulae]
MTTPTAYTETRKTTPATTARRGPRAWLAAQPAWARVLAVYVASRLLSTALLGAMFATATAQQWAFASPRIAADFFAFLSSWDASYYRTIATAGYPAELPLNTSGEVEPNAWAFLPLFPMLSRGLMAVTGLGFNVVAPLIALVCGGVAALLLYRMLRLRVGHVPSFWAVVFFCFGPLSFILQTAYAESLYLALLFGALWAVLARRYLLVIPFGVLAAFTRPGILALALMLGIHFLVRLWRSGTPRRWWGRWAPATTQPFSLRDRLSLVAAGLLIAAAGLSWPLIADAVTGYPDAYLETELAWWTGFVGRQHFAPLTPWFVMSTRYLGWWGAVLVLAVAAGFAAWLLRRRIRPLGHELLTFSGSYALYLVAVFLPQQSLFRMVLPMAPLLGDPALSATRARRVTLLCVGIALQPVAIVLLWFVGYP